MKESINSYSRLFQSPETLIYIFNWTNTAWKVSIFGVFLVRISEHSDWIRTRKTPNTDIFDAVREINLPGLLKSSMVERIYHWYLKWSIIKVYDVVTTKSSGIQWFSSPVKVYAESDKIVFSTEIFIYLSSVIVKVLGENTGVCNSQCFWEFCDIRYLYTYLRIQFLLIIIKFRFTCGEWKPR